MEEATVNPDMRLIAGDERKPSHVEMINFRTECSCEIVLGEHIVRVLHLCDALATTVFQLPVFLLLDRERVEVSH